MMRFVWPVISLLIAAGLQGNLPRAVSLWGGQPDFILVVLIAYALAADPSFGAELGFLSGLIHGCAVGVSLGSFIVTRTIVGFLAGFTTGRLFSENPIVPVISAAWLTFVCEIVFLLANPVSEVGVALRTVGGECLLNSLLTLILCWILHYFSTRRKIRLANARI